MSALLEVSGLSTRFAQRGGFLGRAAGYVDAVRDVSFDLDAGETLSVVGESGSGKSTLARTIIGLERPHAGRVVFDGVDMTTGSPKMLRAVRRDVQMVFQDPFSSLNPRRRVGDLVGEGWEAHPEIAPPARDRARRIGELMDRVGLDPGRAAALPHQLSGGQRQRVGIARALALQPKLLICDEAVSALDVSIQAQIVNLLADLSAELKLAYLFISHDLSVVRHISDRVAVMRCGEFVETGSRDEIFTNPQHAYTRELLAAIPPTRPWATTKTAIH